MTARRCFFLFVGFQILLIASLYSQPCDNCQQTEECSCEEPKPKKCFHCHRRCSERSKSYEDSYIHEIDEFNNQEYDTAWPGKNEDAFYDFFTR